MLDLHNPDYKNNKKVVKDTRNYITVCAKLINNADTRRILEKDLGWGTFLNNLLKRFINAVIYIMTVGISKNFFTIEKSKVINAIDEETNNILTVTAAT
jgi:hypothetical protein